MPDIATLPALDAVADACAAEGVTADMLVAMAAAVDETLDSRAPIVALRDRIAARGVEVTGFAVERHLLSVAAAHGEALVERQPVSDVVKRLLREELDHMAHLDGRALATADVAGYPFVAMCRFATMRRWPAGQLHWEVSGIPRSTMLRASPRGVLRLAWHVATRFRGRAPVFFNHLAWRRRTLVLSEAEQLRSYHRIAESMRLQPTIRGMVAGAWFHSPDTYRVSPHLAWMNRAFLENGGIVEICGPAAHDSGVFAGGAERRRAFDAGTFTPTLGLALWPRAALLGWADAHPEFAS